jgi:hypothetical protein
MIILIKIICNFSRKTDNDPRHSLMIDKFKQCKDQIQKIGVIFNEIKTKPFKIIGVKILNKTYKL